ncbi:MAG: nuclease A inhibitor family protein [Kovacikia sp.]
MSEIDAPFVVMQWSHQGAPTLNAETILQLTNHPPTAPVKVLAVDDFFAAATEEQEWFGEEEKATAARYRELVALLKQYLNDLTVYQVGDVSLDLYVVGHTPEGELFALATQASET